MAGRGAHHGGLNWEIDDPGEHGRATERGTGGGGWFIRSPDPTKSMGAYLGTLRTRFVGCFQGHDSPAEVRKWFASTEAKMTTRVIIGRELFPTLTPALASHWAASLTAMLFTATVPPRVAAQGNVLFQTPAEYATAGILFGELRRRFIVPLAHLLLYELVCQEKRAEIAQALTQQRGAAQAVGDVDDYSALKELLSSPAFTLLESLEDAVWAKGVAVAQQSTSAVAGATRTVVLAMRQEQNDLFNYATVGHETCEFLAKYFDDFKLNSPFTDDADDDFDVFIRCLEDFLLAAIAYDVELGPPKTSAGFAMTVFFGVEIHSSGGSGLAPSRIEAIRALKYPTNVSELRQVLGLLTQCRKWVEMYSTSSNSLSRLLKDGVLWDFGAEQQRDFDALRNALINSTLNYAPDYVHELILSTDASDYAIGSRLFQLIDDVEYNIGFWSRTLTLSEQKMAVYFRELLAILEGIRRARIYALSSPLPLRVQTDQRSLIFVDALAKGPISHHHLAAVADVNYKIEYIMQHQG